MGKIKNRLHEHKILALHLARRLRRIDSDGCTMSPDFNFYDCCVWHDYYYRHPASPITRAQADKLLYYCIKRKSNCVIAGVYYAAVRVGGAKAWVEEDVGIGRTIPKVPKTGA